MTVQTIPGVNGKEIKIPVRGEYYYNDKGEEFVWDHYHSFIDSQQKHTCMISEWKTTGRFAASKNQRSLVQLK